MASTYSIEWPDYFDGRAGEIADKGYFADLTIRHGDRRYRPVFYDLVRLAQTAEDELGLAGYFADAGLVIVPQVTREHIERAVAALSRDDFAALPPT